MTDLPMDPTEHPDEGTDPRLARRRARRGGGGAHRGARSDVRRVPGARRRGARADRGRVADRRRAGRRAGGRPASLGAGRARRWRRRGRGRFDAGTRGVALALAARDAGPRGDGGDDPRRDRDHAARTNGSRWTRRPVGDVGAESAEGRRAGGDQPGGWRERRGEAARTRCWIRRWRGTWRSRRAGARWRRHGARACRRRRRRARRSAAAGWRRGRCGGARSCVGGGRARVGADRSDRSRTAMTRAPGRADHRRDSVDRGTAAASVRDRRGGRSEDMPRDAGPSRCRQRSGPGTVRIGRCWRWTGQDVGQCCRQELLPARQPGRRRAMGRSVVPARARGRSGPAGEARDAAVLTPAGETTQLRARWSPTRRGQRLDHPSPDRLLRVDRARSRGRRAVRARHLRRGANERSRSWPRRTRRKGARRRRPCGVAKGGSCPPPQADPRPRSARCVSSASRRAVSPVRRADEHRA